MKTKAWIQSNVKDGVVEIRCRGWPSFEKFVHQLMIDLPDYVWRGQRCTDWPILPSLDRRLKFSDDLSDINARRNMLRRFKVAARGRRGPSAPPITTENEWWALGQHYGLATPLLDWTSSPFIASYFAFADMGRPQTTYRVIYGLSARMAHIKTKTLKVNERLQFASPLSDDNARLLCQRGVFTKLPVRVDVESWVKKNFFGNKDKWVLIKILIPTNARVVFLRSLERMAISPLDLFPDIYGASLYCNLGLEIKNYSQALVETDIFDPTESVDE